MRNIIVLVLLCLCGLSCAQNITDIAFKCDFAAQVKSIDEFICRFNGMEIKPGLKNNPQILRDNLLSLFDFQMDHANLSDHEFREQLSSFTNNVIDSDTKLSITDEKMWAEVDILATINGRKEKVSLFMQSEIYKDSLIRWAIVHVTGLAKAGIIDTVHYYVISPVEHEVNFSSIDDIFNNSRSAEIMGYRGKNTPIDELSVLFAFSMLGRVKIDMVNKVTIHCLNVPDFVFTINEFGRNGDNSGWLISSLMPMKESDKQEYIKQILKR